MQALRQNTQRENIHFMPLDLTSQENVRQFAHQFIEKFPVITHLLLNAGLQILTTQFTPEGTLPPRTIILFPLNDVKRD